MAGRQSAADRRNGVNQAAAQFFAAVSFDEGGAPRLDELRGLFIERGMLINRSGDEPVLFTVDEFITTRRASLGAGGVTRYRVTSMSETTEIFGGVAHRACAFVRAGVKGGQPFEVRGMIFMQMLFTAAGWRLSAVAWDDQRPGQALSGHAEPTEFGPG